VIATLLQTTLLLVLPSLLPLLPPNSIDGLARELIKQFVLS